MPCCPCSVTPPIFVHTIPPTLHAALAALPPPPLLARQALQRVAGAFKPGATVIVRSSANVEDLAGMSGGLGWRRGVFCFFWCWVGQAPAGSPAPAPLVPPALVPLMLPVYTAFTAGAGLYDSIPNVDSGNPGALQAAVAGVWASLFSRRAVLSRHAAGGAGAGWGWELGRGWRRVAGREAGGTPPPAAAYALPCCPLGPPPQLSSFCCAVACQFPLPPALSAVRRPPAPAGLQACPRRPPAWL